MSTVKVAVDNGADHPAEPGVEVGNSRCAPRRGRARNWSEVTWLPVLAAVVWNALAMTSAWSRSTKGTDTIRAEIHCKDSA